MVEKFNETDLMKEIKSCTYEQDYETAVKLADKLELNKIRNVSSLCLLGEVFLHEGELDSAERKVIPRRNTTIKNLFPLRHGIYIGIFSDIVWTREKANGFRFSSIRLNS